MFSIKLEGVSKVYPKGSVGLSGIHLSIASGEFVFLTGQNGSGKSTLLQLLTKEQQPTEGIIYFNDMDITNLPKDHIPFLRRRMGIVQESIQLLNRYTVYQNIELALLATGQTEKYCKEAIPKVLGMVGMKQKMYVYPQELSGGECSRIMLARAIVNNPEVLIADEPTAGLDATAAWDMMNLFDEINRLGVTIVMATHDKEMVNLMKKRVVTLFEGRLLGDVKKGRYGDIV